MFTSLRYFFGLSFILIMLAAYGIGFLIHSMVAEGLEMVVKRNNIALSQGFANSVWDKYYNTAPNSLTSSNFISETRRFTEKLSLLQFNLYDETGKKIFYVNKQKILGKDNKPLDLYDKSLIIRGNISSRAVENALISISGSDARPVNLVQTIYPITNPNYNPSNSVCASAKNAFNAQSVAFYCNPIKGIIEIYVDTTAQWNQLFSVRLVSSLSIVAIFIILISMLYFTTRRAEAIIAKQHEVNLELTAAAASAEAENQDKSQFLANISHELRTPLNAIIGFSEIIKGEAMVNLNETHQGYIKDINNSGIHLLSLINDILDFSKAEAGKLELQLDEIDLSKLIKNSMRLVIPRAEEAQVTLIEDLPSEHIICTTDAKKLKQVLLNLLSNAVKFTPPGGDVKVTVWEQITNRSVCIQVSDSGIGIAPKDISKVMTPFGQVDSKLSRKYEGTGLGLPLSKKFVEAMGGQFIIESEVNVGTTITITLPPAEADAA